MPEKADESALPVHLRGLPRLEDADFLLGGLSNDELLRLPAAVNEIQHELNISRNPKGVRYLILGSYDTPDSDRNGPKDRLEDTKEFLETLNPGSTAVLLDDLDPDNDDWENFYVKLRYTMATTDYNVLVAEDNDGGHELELGEALLSETYVAKRDYGHASLDRDLEYEKYDAMMSTLFKLMDRRGHLFEWETMAEFVDAIEQVGDATSSPPTR